MGVDFGTDKPLDLDRMMDSRFMDGLITGLACGGFGVLLIIFLVHCYFAGVI